MTPHVREAALAAHAAGLCVVPPREDGSKAPIGPWKRYMLARPTLAELDGWYGPRTGIGLVCGAVSGGLEMLEFEGRAVAAGLLESFIDAAIAAGFGPLVERIRAGYEEWTPGGGIHWQMHVPTPRANTVLAARPATPEEMAAKPADRVKVLIETRGEGGFTIVAPSAGAIHPSGRPWVLASGGFDTIATISDEERDALHELARLFDAMPPVTPRAPSAGRSTDGDRPGDRYDALPDPEGRIEDLLVRRGWTVVSRRGGTTYLRRPGKEQGISATLGHHPGLLIVFSTNTPFEATSRLGSPRLRSLRRLHDPRARWRLGGCRSGAATDPGAAAGAGQDGAGDRRGGAARRGTRRRCGEGRSTSARRRPTRTPPEPDDPGHPMTRPPDDEDRTEEGPAPIFARLGARWLRDVPHAPPPDLLLDRLDAQEDTVLFGAGDTGKGVLACAWIVGLTRDGHRVLVLDYENHPGEWSRRIRALGGIEAADRVIHVAPTGPAWLGPRGAIWQQQGELRELADATGATFVVVDSAAVACGGADSLKPEAPGQYFPALRYLGRPSLTLAHVTKGDDLRYPFGSVFWHNLARVTWSAEKVGAQGHQVILSHRKGNNHAHQGKQLVTITWWEGLPAEVREETYNVKLAVLIKAVLRAEGPSTVAQIVAALNADLDEGDPRIKPDSVRAALRRGIRTIPQEFTVKGEVWSDAA